MSALSPQAYGFINRIRSLHSLDKYAVPFLTSGEWVQFRDDPVKFLMRANDETAAAICAAVEARQPTPANPAQGVSDEMVEAACDAAYRVLNAREGVVFTGLEKRPVPPSIQEWMRAALTAALQERSGQTLAAFNDLSAKYPIGHPFVIEHDGFAGEVIGYYVTREGKRGVNLQLDGAKVVHVYGEKWLAPAAPTGGAK